MQVNTTATATATTTATSSSCCCIGYYNWNSGSLILHYCS